VIDRVLSRVLRMPTVAVRLFVNRWYAPFWLRLNGAELGEGCRFDGLPFIRYADGSRIEIGNRVFVASWKYGNPATLPYRSAFSTLSPDAFIRIGDNAGLSGVSIAAASGVEIGERTLVGSGALIWDTDFHPLDPEMRRVDTTAGALSAPIQIGSDVFIGGRAVILKGVSIGDGAVVAAGAIVTKDIESGDVVGGNPARVIRRHSSLDPSRSRSVDSKIRKIR